jgi:hypothetical protein
MPGEQSGGNPSSFILAKGCSIELRLSPRSPAILALEHNKLESKGQPQTSLEEGEGQDTFIENRDPTEMMLCVILAAAYLGLAKYCWAPLWAAHNMRLLVSVEGFFTIIAMLAIAVGLRPYLTPSSLQISHRGIKYRGPYWPQRRTVNWEQVERVYISSELIIVLYYPKPSSKRKWFMLIASVYLSERDKIPDVIEKYCSAPCEVMQNPAIYSRIAMGLLFLAAVVWILEMLMS